MNQKNHLKEGIKGSNMSFPPENSSDIPDEVSADPSKNSLAAAAPAKPRVWTLFLTSLCVFVLVIALQIAATLVTLLIQAVQGQPLEKVAEELPSLMMAPPMFVLTIILSGLGTTTGALLFGRFSAKHASCPLRERLGMRWPPISALSLVVFLLGSIPVLLVSLGAVYLVSLVLSGDESLLATYKNMPNGWAVVFIVAIGIFPGIGEELFFRGFFQRRMLQRYGPWVAIGVTSVVFGLFHITPHAIALATIIGVWLGVIAWRTNSIWPSACCHAFINSGWNVYQVGRFHWGIPDVPPNWFLALGGLFTLAAFGASVWILLKMDPRSTAA